MTLLGSVAFVAASLDHGGGERVIVEQVRALGALDVPIDVWVTKGEGPGNLAAEVAAAAPRVREVARVRSVNALALRLAVRRPDVVLTCHTRRGYRALLRLRRVPLAPPPVVIETFHERTRWSVEPYGGVRPRAIDAALMTYDLHAWVGPFANLPDDRLFVARPLFPSSLVTLDAAARTAGRALRAALGIGPDAVAVGYLGRAGDNKGLLSLVDAVRTLVRRGHDVHLVLAGRPCPELGDFDGRLSAAMVAAGASDPACRGRFHRLGVVGDVAATYAAFDVIALLSRTEGLLPLMLVEAMSAGIPALTTDVGGIATCLVDGTHAEVVRKSPDDESDLSPAALADATARLERLVSDRARRTSLGAAGAARVRALVAANDFHGDTRRAVEAAFRAGPRRA